MSTPPSPRSPTPLLPTRQQLDELDSLLQRMLALPVNQLEDDFGSSDPGPAVPLPAPVAPPVVAGPTSPSASVSRPPNPSPPPPGEKRTEPADRPSQPAPATEEARPDIRRGHGHRLAPAGRLPAGRWVRPLVWGNRVFDRWAARLGRPGHWLRQPRGRTLLGWTGLLFLAAALTLVLLDWIGWAR